MDTLDRFFAALQTHNWYPAAALALMLVIEVVRNGQNAPLVKYLTALWYRIPDGWRWTPQVAVGSFIGAFNGGANLTQALLAALGGALGIGGTAMGLHALVKESPIPVDGGAGGNPLPPKP